MFLITLLTAACISTAFADKVIEVSGIKFRLEKTELGAEAYVINNYHDADWDVDNSWYDELEDEGYHLHSVIFNYKGDIIIPETIMYDGTPYYVVGIDANAFSAGFREYYEDIYPEDVPGKRYIYFGDHLKSVTIPKTVKSIGAEAFSHCYGLHINISDLKAWCNISFEGSPVSDSHYYLYLNGEEIRDIVIPESVTRIGNYTFSGCFLNSVTIPNSVTSIGQQAFSYLGLKYVTISDLEAWCKISFSGISSNPLFYAHHLFMNGEEIKDLVIPESVTSIGNYSFSGCMLTSVTIPNSVTSIGESAFSSCSLTSITIPNSVTSIGESAFSVCSELISIAIPNSVTSIGNYTFKGCNSLDSVTIPNSVTSIGESAFYGCSKLNFVAIGNSVTSIGQQAFSGCSNLNSVTIGNSVNSIGESAFQDCSRLNSVTIGNSVTSIGQQAFSGCSSLNSVTIGNSVTSIGRQAFSGCTSLTSVTVSDLDTWCKISFSYNSNPLYYAHHLFMNGEEIKDLVIPESVQTIGGSAFSGCSSLTSVSIPKSITTIGESAFSGCENLTSVTISDLEAWCKISFSGASSNPLFYAHHLLINGEEIKDLVIPESVTSIGNCTFSGCMLTSVTIPNSVTSIGGSAFGGCKDLKCVILNCREVGAWFRGFTSIETVEIGDGVESIGASAFNRCTAITTLAIGKNVTSIGLSAFANCNNNLNSVTSYIKTPFRIDDSVFQNSLWSGTILYVPSGTKQSYQNTSAWNQIPTITEMSDGGSGEDENVEGFTLYGKDLQTMAGAQAVLPIELTNEDEVKLCQFDLSLPIGVTVAEKSNGKLDAKLTERAESHSVSSQRLSNGDYRFVVSSLDNDSFAGNIGTLMEITLDIPASMEEGEYVVKVFNAELSVPDGNDLIVVKPANVESKLIVENYTPGDVNNDGSVSVTDVGCAINYILEQVPSVFIFDAADMNGDKNISVTDVGLIINFILNNEAYSPQRTPKRSDNENTVLPSISLQPTEGGYELQLEKKCAYVGFQFDVELSGNSPLNEVQLNDADHNDHLLNYRRLDNGKWRVVCYSLSNSTFADDGAALLNILTSGDIIINDIRLTTVGLDERRIASISGMSTGIANIEQGMQMIMNGSALRITSDYDTTLRLLTMDGSLFRILHVRKGENIFSDLPTGIYMINHKKIIIP